MEMHFALVNMKFSNSALLLFVLTVECGPGLQGKDVCTLCELGTYKPSAGYDACQPCPSNWNSNANRTTCNVGK
jgi:uncharacterized membrane protein